MFARKSSFLCFSICITLTVNYSACSENAVKNWMEEGIACKANEQKCMKRCCPDDEICFNGVKCVAKRNTDCPSGTHKCLDKCCAYNELCSAQKNECIVKDTAEIAQCDESQKCQDKCCSINEICLNKRECVTNNTANLQCPEQQKCLEKCCSLTETCQNGKECVFKASSIVKCPEERLCLNKCCTEHEKCSGDGKCVSKESGLLNASELFTKCEDDVKCLHKDDTVFDCLESLKCHGTCCDEQQFCNSGKCVPQETMDNKCPASRKCQQKCCQLNEICSNENECVETTIERNSFNCLQTQKCLNKCCNAHEKCSETFECVPMETLLCHVTDICGHKCCPVNETCNDNNQCVPFVEVTTINSCPEELLCGDNCCSPKQVCNELIKECVHRQLPELSTLYDFSHELILSKSEKHTNIDDSTVRSSINQQHNIKCPLDRQPCQNECCTAQQVCITEGQCIEQLKDSDPENDKITHGTDMFLPYTMIGVGCLMTVLSFALFKVYNFRRTKNFF